MPARSEAQRRYLNSKFGHDWVKEHHFDNKGALPARVGKKKQSKKSSHISDYHHKHGR
jgi:hypothetical protein